MSERRVLVTIDPPEPGRCWIPAQECRHLDPEVFCDLGFHRDGLKQDRPAACIAAEAEVAALQGGIIARVQEIADGLWPHGTEKRDRVAEALDAVFCLRKDQP